MVELIQFDDLGKMIHHEVDHPIKAKGIVNLPQVPTFWASPPVTLPVSCQDNRNPVPEKFGDRSHNVYHLLRGLIVYWVDPLGHSLNKVFIPLIKTRGILLFRIEGMLFDREILPSAVCKNRPSELHQTCAVF